MEDETLKKLDKVSPTAMEVDCGETGEERHFFTCRLCGQMFDMRSLRQSAHHNRPGHAQMSEAELSEVAFSATA
jgi:hypothetical protein